MTVNLDGTTSSARVDTGVDAVTGAFSYSGRSIAQRLLGRGRTVRTLTGHPQQADGAHEIRPDALQLRVKADDVVVEGALRRVHRARRANRFRLGDDVGVLGAGLGAVRQQHVAVAVGPGVDLRAGRGRHRKHSNSRKNELQKG